MNQLDAIALHLAHQEVRITGVVGPLGVDSVTGIAFAGNGTLFGISDPTLVGSGEGGTGDLIVVDPATGASVPVLHVTDEAVDGPAAILH